MWCKNPLDLFRLSTLVMSDPIPDNRVDTTYLFGHTPDNEVSVLKAGLELYNNKVTKKLGVLDGGPYIPPNSSPDAKIAYSGYTVWSDTGLLDMKCNAMISTLFQGRRSLTPAPRRTG